jgi:hypothetical protein
LSYHDLKFWRRVEYRREKLQEAIRIKQSKVIAAVTPTNGSAPYCYRQAYEVTGERLVSRAEHEEARRLFLRRIAINRARADLPYETTEEFASGVYAFEMEEARHKAFTAGTVRGGLGVPDTRTTRTSEVHPLSHEEWDKGGYTVTQLLPIGFTAEEIAALGRLLRGKPAISRGRGRPRKNGSTKDTTT